MSAFWALYRKELSTVFYSPIAYLLLTVFLVVLGYTFCAQLFHTLSPSLVATYYQAVVLLLLVVPLLTMRQIAEERANGTLELLLSTAVAEITILFAKFCASVTVIALLLVTMLALPLALQTLTPVDWGIVATSTVGLFLAAMALVAVGLAASAVTRNQVIAAVLSLGIFLTLWSAEALGIYLPPPLDDLVIGLSFDTRLAPFVTGLVYLSDIGFFLSLTWLGLALAAAALIQR